MADSLVRSEGPLGRASPSQARGSQRGRDGATRLLGLRARAGLCGRVSSAQAEGAWVTHLGRTSTQKRGEGPPCEDGLGAARANTEGLWCLSGRCCGRPRDATGGFRAGPSAQGRRDPRQFLTPNRSHTFRESHARVPRLPFFPVRLLWRYLSRPERFAPGEGV